MEGNSPTQAVKTARRTSWILGITYALLVGSHVPVNFQATLILSLLTLGLFEQIQLTNKACWRAKTALGVGLLNSLGFTLISNHRVQDLHWLVAYTTVVYMTLLIERNTKGVSNGLTFAFYMCSTPFQKTMRCFRNDVWTNLCHFSLGDKSISLDAGKIGAGVVSSVILLIFTALLGTVNAAFQKFMEAVLTNIYDFIAWLFSIELIENALVAVFIAGIVYALTAPEEQKTKYREIKFFQASHYYIIIVPLLALLFAFCCFQMEFLGINPQLLSYKELSQYVRKGFFELLHVAVLGAFLWYFAEKAPTECKKTKKRIRILLGIFAVELFALSIFSHHKLFAQQIIFGLRDQRVLASAGTLLLTGSFIGFVAILIKKITHRQLLDLQIAGLILTTFILSYGNLDGTISSTRPLQFEYGEKLYNDHAYLLTNSYDNSSDWLKYIEEVYQTGVILPENYYWGVYQPLCYKGYTGRGRPNSPFTSHMNNLKQRYSPEKRESFRDILKFNFREFNAYQQIRTHGPTFNKFHAYLEVACSETSKYIKQNRRSRW